MNHALRRGVALAMALVTAVVITGCSDQSSGSGSAASSDQLTAAAMKSPKKGQITWCAQADSSGAFTAITKAYNAANKSKGYSIKLLQFPANTDQWRTQFVQRENAKSSECDVFGSDVTWTAEFADKGYLYDLTPYIKSNGSGFIPSTLKTVQYKGKDWAVPFGTNVGSLFYRTDKVKTAPTTWQQAYADARGSGGIVYQGSAYEGLTVNFLEIAAAAGGSVLSSDGKKSVIDSPQNLKALQLMVNGVQNGSAPKAVLTYTEEETRRAFESGSSALERNWAYVYTLGKQNKTIANKFDLEPLPAFEGGTGKGGAILGGVNMVVSKFSNNPGAALRAVDYITSEPAQVIAAGTGQPPTLSSAYDDPAVQKAFPFYEVLKAGVAQATSRPVTPVYAQVSQAIYSNVSQALSGSVTPQAALKTADQQITKALSAF